MGIGLRKRGQQRTGGAVIAEMLAAEGVRHVFGIIDGSYFGLYSALEPAGIRLIGPRHEASAAHMAGAYARLTGGLGVCMASNGPGVANMLSGIAVEHTEGNRVLVITSCRRTGACSPDRGGTFQCFPHTAVTGPITRWAATVPSAERLPEMVRKALRAAWAGRPGVVHLDVPEDILNGTHAFPSERGWAPERYRALEGPQPSPAQVDRALAMLLEAERPMLHVGAGVVHARAFEPLARVAEALQLPVTTSWPGRSAYPETSPLSVPLTHIETHRTVRNEADCVLTLGSRLAETDWWGKPPYWRDPAEQRMIQVDIEARSIGLHKPVDLGIVADVGAFLRALAERLEHSPPEIDLAARRDWLESIARARAKERARLERLRRQRADGVHSARLVALTRELTARDAIVVLDGGNTAVWGQFFYELREPNTLLTTWKMGMLGAGVGQAIGAAVACPDRQVVALMGDGAMAFHIQELETAVRFGLPVVYVVLCDRAWGMVKMGQQIATRPVKALLFKKLAEHEYTGTDFAPVRFDRVAEAMGARGAYVDREEAYAAALTAALAHRGPSVIHVEVDPVRHMWAPGLKTFKDMHLEPAGASR